MKVQLVPVFRHPSSGGSRRLTRGLELKVGIEREDAVESSGVRTVGER